jgi:predicted AlkP superfamily pyrophosphatase or phosphodiesterase
MFARAYFPGRAAQVFVVPERGDFLVNRNDEVYQFMHGSPWSYDVEIPILFYGTPFIRAGSYAGAARQQDVAPTIAAVLGLPVPPSMSGRVLSEALQGGTERPKVVLVGVLDGMRRDGFDRWADRLPALSRFRREGAWFSEAAVDYVPSVTSAGHASIATGTDPRFHGINANATFDRRTRKSDSPFPGMSPRNYMVLTLADHWNLATGGRAVILVQGTTPRAAVALAGYGGCAANELLFPMAMFDEASAGWVTNADCYRLPEYLKSENAKWAWEAAGGTWMGHEVKNGARFLRTAYFPRFQVDALIQMIEKESVGADDVPDLLMVNFKTPDYVSHQYGPDSPEMGAALAALDEELSRVLKTLEERAGPSETVVAITADHGMPPEPESRHERRYVEDIVETIHDGLDPTGRRLVLVFTDAANLQISVDPDRVKELGLTMKQVAQFVEGLPYIRAAFTEDEVRAVRLPR